MLLTPVFEDRASSKQLIADLARTGPVKPFVVAVEDGSLNEVMSAADITAVGLEGEVVHLARRMGLSARYCSGHRPRRSHSATCWS